MVAPATKTLDRILTLLADCLNRESAERVMQFSLDDETKAYIDQLADKANEGQLTEKERAEYAEYIDALDWIGILRAKAERVLTSPKRA